MVITFQKGWTRRECALLSGWIEKGLARKKIGQMNLALDYRDARHMDVGVAKMGLWGCSEKLD
jgi:hypothetical protein